MQGSRPRHPQRALLGAALVQALALARILGCVWSTAGAAALRTGHPGYLVVDLKLKSAPDLHNLLLWKPVFEVNLRFIETR
jgi:hypothetical protein